MLAPMQKKTMIRWTNTFVTVCFMLLRLLSSGQTGKNDSIQIITEKVDTLDIVGKYEGVICFKNECLTTKLLLKSNHNYVVRLISNNNGRKNKSTKHGTWLIESNELILKQTLSLKDPATIKPQKYKIVNGDLWYYSDETSNLIEIAMKKIK